MWVALGHAWNAAKNACKINSFDYDTPVLMADGTLKQIADVELGDLVWAADPVTGEEGPRAVVDLIRHAGLHTMVAIRLADGTTIDATDGHPFWVGGRAPPTGLAEGGAWVNAIDLEVGDRLLDEDGEPVTIAGLAISVVDLTAYNLTIAGLHTYYAGEYPALVHNSGKGGWADDVMKYWDRGTYGSRTHSIRDHFARHGLPGQSLKEYATQGVDLAKKVGATGKRRTVGGRGGGIVSPQGKTFTTW